MSSATVEKLERINAITSNFFFWQGLRWVPMGAALLFVAWAYRANAPIPETLRVLLILAAMLGAIALSGVVGRWYDRSFGRVRGIPGQHARRTRTKWLVVYPLVAIAFVLDGLLKMPVLLSGIAFAAAIEAYRRSTGGGRPHYIVASAVLMVVTFTPMLGLATRGAGALNFLLGVLGATYVIGGVLDHLALKRFFPDVRDGDAIAGAGSAR